MKNRASTREKPETKPDKRASHASAKRAEPSTVVVPTAALRKLEQLGKEIAGIRSELAKLAAARAREHATGSAPRR